MFCHLLLVVGYCRGELACKPFRGNETSFSLRRLPGAYAPYNGNKLRIKVVYSDVFQATPNFSKIKDEYIEPAIEFWRVTLKAKVPTVGPIKVNKPCAYGTYFEKDADGIVRPFCDGQCDETRVCGEFTIAQKYSEPCRKKVLNKNVVGNDGGPGLDDADMLLIATIEDMSSCAGKMLAFAGTCQRNPNTDRPEVSVLNYCPKETKFAPEFKKDIYTITVHEVGHALGFGSDSFAFMRDENGKPRTARDKNNFPITKDKSKGYIPDKNTAEEITQPWTSDLGNFTIQRMVLKTKRVLEEAKKHLNCSTMTGVPFENNGGAESLGHHFEMAVFREELMTATIGAGTISRLTLAYMEDTGWYTVDYSKAQPLTWGANLGCTFATGNCYVYMKQQIAANKPIAPWCNIANDKCRDGKVCGYYPLKIKLENYQIIDSKRMNYGGLDIDMDFCPTYRNC